MSGFGGEKGWLGVLVGEGSVGVVRSGTAGLAGVSTGLPDGKEQVSSD
jgi:hypothetical protein